jgi:transposase, IS5 family
MSRRDLSQPSFVDAMVSGYGKSGGFLDRIEPAFDWLAFEALLAPIHASTRGAPGYPPLVMFKILLVQQWHALSDPGAEEAVRDRLSFRRFCGLPLEADTPDHASIWRFRQTIDKLGLSAALLSETNRQLDALGLIVKRGTLVDATLIAAAVKRPPYGRGGINPRDPDARVTIFALRRLDPPLRRRSLLDGSRQRSYPLARRPRWVNSRPVAEGACAQ